MSSKRQIILLARWHAASRCKTRLSKKIGIQRAATIQRQLTMHTISVAASIKKQGLADFQLSISGIGPKASHRLGKRLGIKTVAIQGPGTLGLRMKREVCKTQWNFGSPFEQAKEIILIGTDLPTLCKSDLIEALEALKSSEMVLGPSTDGGYWLLGLGERLLNPLVSWPFCGIPWGTNQVLTKTILKAKKENIKLGFLRQQNDLDNLEDLKPWLR